MSKTSKTKTKQENKKKKQQKKENQRLKYQAWAAAGTNNKSKRSVLNSRRRRKSNKHEHRFGACGNPGCTTCFGPRNLNPGRGHGRKKLAVVWRSKNKRKTGPILFATQFEQDVLMN
jgi:hypothetical protein